MPRGGAKGSSQGDKNYRSRDANHFSSRGPHKCSQVSTFEGPSFVEVAELHLATSTSCTLYYTAFFLSSFSDDGVHCNYFPSVTSYLNHLTFYNFFILIFSFYDLNFYEKRVLK